MKLFEVCYDTAEPSGAAPATEQPAVAVEAQAEPSEQPTEGEAAPQPTPVQHWAEKRLAVVTKEWRQTQAQVAELQRQMAAQTIQPPAGQFTEEEVNRRAGLMAQQIAAQTQFDAMCNSVYDSGVAAHGDEFIQSLNAIKGICGGAPPPVLIEAAYETGKAGDILHALGKEPDKAMEILSLPPMKMAARLATMAAGLTAKPRAASKVPPPITPQVNGRGTVQGSLDDPDISMGEYVKRREKQLADRRKA